MNERNVVSNMIYNVKIYAYLCHYHLHLLTTISFFFWRHSNTSFMRVC